MSGRELKQRLTAIVAKLLSDGHYGDDVEQAVALLERQLPKRQTVQEAAREGYDGAQAGK